MTHLNRLIRNMQQLERQLSACMRCGMCQSVCPIYGETGMEGDVARGKLALLSGLLDQLFDDPRGTYERLNRCLLCGACEFNCPSGVGTLEIFLKARAVITDFLGLSPVKRAVLRGMLAHPERLDKAMEWGVRFQKVLTRPVNDFPGTSCAGWLSPLLGNRRFRPLAETPFHRQVPRLDITGGRSGLRTALFVGCLIDKVFPAVAHAAVTALQYHGVDIFIPESQACCGIPALASGDTQTFETLVERNVAQFSTGRYDYLLTACATCTATIRKMWPMMIFRSQTLKTKATRVSEKTMDIHRFLVEKTGAASAAGRPARTRSVVTYHDPCHLKKTLGVYREPRRLIRSNPRVLLREMAEPDRCCGMGGSFNLYYYELSTEICAPKLADIRNTRCETVATACPACMLQLSDAVSRSGERIRVKHVMELYADAVNQR